MVSKTLGRNHYVLVHGVCHGAWCWYKLKPLLETAGDRVTVLNLAASGIDSKKIEDVDTFSEYSVPLLELLASLPPNEKVILLGHSFGGLSIALAMERFPDKVAVGVFLTASMPDTQHKPAYVLDQYTGRNPMAEMKDEAGSKSLLSFDPNYLSNMLYQHCSTEDIEMAKTLIRPGSFFIEDLSKTKNFSKEGYGSVPRAFIICKEDLAIPLEFQLWMVQNAGIDHLEEINGADHMAMLSKPQELYHALLKIADKYT